MANDTDTNRVDLFFDNLKGIGQQVKDRLPEVTTLPKATLKNRRKETKPKKDLPVIRPVHPKITAAIIISISLLTFLFVILEYFIFDVPSRALSGGELGFNITFVSIFGSLFLFYILIDRWPVMVNIIIFLQTAILVGLIIVNPDSSRAFMVLAFPLSAMAGFLLPVRNAIFWMILFFVIGGVNVAYIQGFRELLPYSTSAGALAAFGLIGGLIRRSNQAYYSIESLYDELHETHMQLTDYSKGVRQLAVSEERNRVAREMHDSLGHSLTVAVVQLEGAEKLIPKDPERAAGIIGNMRGQLKQALTELRSTLAQLRSDEEDEMIGNLAVALTELKINFMQATELDIQLNMPDHLPELYAEQRHALYRAAQEGLTNVQRHANGSRAWITLTPKPTGIALSVADNGKGFPEEVADGRFGIRGLRERAEFFGGTVERRNRPTGGGELIFSIPYDFKDRDKG